MLGHLSYPEPAGHTAHTAHTCGVNVCGDCVGCAWSGRLAWHRLEIRKAPIAGLHRAQQEEVTPGAVPSRHRAACVPEDHDERRLRNAGIRQTTDRRETDQTTDRRGNPMNRTFHRIALASLVAASFAAISLPRSSAGGTHAALASSNHDAVRFPLVRSAGAVKANCL